MQSSMVVAGMDALSTLRKHFDTSGKSAALFHHRAICKTPMALPDNGLFGAIAGKKSLPTIAVAPPTPWSSGHQRERPLVKTSKARATGALTRTDLRTGATMMGAFIQQLLYVFSTSSLN